MNSYKMYLKYKTIVLSKLTEKLNALIKIVYAFLILSLSLIESSVKDSIIRFKIIIEIVFSSEVKAFFEFPGITPKIDKEGISELFGLGPAHTPRKWNF